MARPVLPTDFKDDILAESMSGKRRYRIIQNTDGTVSLDDVTDYEQVGSTFGAKQVNDMSSAVNSIEDVKAANNCTTTEPGFVLDARQGKTLMDKSNELSRDFISFQTSFRDGCSTIAAAITEMGVSTASNASPTVMASNIKKIKPLPLEAVAMLGIFGGGNINNSCIVPVDFAGIKSFTYTVYSDGNDNKRYDMYIRSGGLTGGAITNHYGVNGRSQSYTDTVDCTQFHGISGLYFYFSRKLEITNIVRL